MHTTNELLTKALNYSLNQRELLGTFMKDGRIPISNNLCEANIKPFATARRAWLFADTPKGATANADLKEHIKNAEKDDITRLAENASFVYFQLDSIESRASKYA
ncbi:IS66 family transposase [Anaerosacchariphilus polymeriproducens]|uniref:Transposase IS66 central domain-containing protein n=1 Tax=Anaerosacchariphilus polymeriproducens TaxID=1812858 RepID=A0A371AVF8_9FIRM|nr:transposase [Anaerosacchariphilus polymeriproducens]RDU23522.1 hypothetical protein DWV06_09205 [Anaerosacchariphilus polymeriproducens]